MEDAGSHLPHAGVSTVFGLLEMLDDLGGKEDIYEIAQSLNYDLDDLFPVLKAAELLGFVNLHEGDVEMTPLGKEFVDKDVDGRKELLRSRLIEHPVFKEIVSELEASRDHHLSRSFLLEKFETRFSPEESERQLQTVIDWGRYAELVGYNPETEEMYLDQFE